jgi:hypothetical protein
MGAASALPMLDAMTPALANAAQAAVGGSQGAAAAGSAAKGAGSLRLAFTYVPQRTRTKQALSPRLRGIVTICPPDMRPSVDNISRPRRRVR